MLIGTLNIVVKEHDHQVVILNVLGDIVYEIPTNTQVIPGNEKILNDDNIETPVIDYSEKK